MEVIAIFLYVNIKPRVHRPEYRVNRMDTGGNRPDILKFAVVEGFQYLDFYNSGGRINALPHIRHPTGC